MCLLINGGETRVLSRVLSAFYVVLCSTFVLVSVGNKLRGGCRLKVDTVILLSPLWNCT